MNTTRLTKKFSFEMAHALYKYKGKCQNIHGHSYILEVTVIGKPKNQQNHPDDGILIDFGDLKKIVNEKIINYFDHSLVLKSNYPSSLTMALKESFNKVNYVDYQPTCENLIIDCAERIKNSLPDDVSLHHMNLRETGSSSCAWYTSDNT